MPGVRALCSTRNTKRDLPPTCVQYRPRQTLAEHAVKKTDLEKNKALKLANSLKLSAALRAGRDTGPAKVDRREQRRLDQEQGLVPFACKLDAELVKRLQALAPAHAGGMSGLLKEALERGLPAQDAAG